MSDNRDKLKHGDKVELLWLIGGEDQWVSGSIKNSGWFLPQLVWVPAEESSDVWEVLVGNFIDGEWRKGEQA
jgi:hypothetical protein